MMSVPKPRDSQTRSRLVKSCMHVPKHSTPRRRSIQTCLILNPCLRPATAPHGWCTNLFILGRIMLNYCLKPLLKATSFKMTGKNATRVSLRDNSCPAFDQVDDDVAPDLRNILLGDEFDRFLCNQSSNKTGRGRQVCCWGTCTDNFSTQSGSVKEELTSLLCFVQSLLLSRRPFQSASGLQRAGSPLLAPCPVEARLKRQTRGGRPSLSL